MKARHFVLVILLLGLILTVGCTTQVKADIDGADKIISSSESKKETSTFSNDKNNVKPEQSKPESENAKESVTTSASSPHSYASSGTEQKAQPEKTTASKPSSNSKPTEQTTKPQKPASNPNKPTESKPEKTTKPETKPPATAEPKPEFDINHWINYAKNYAKQVGLTLNSCAVDCWDNPIGAGSNSVYLERDIQSRLNRYAKDEDITDVWIWAEKTGNGNYELYIGYA